MDRVDDRGRRFGGISHAVPCLEDYEKIVRVGRRSLRGRVTVSIRDWGEGRPEDNSQVDG